jgi:hypothetical protein
VKKRNNQRSYKFHTREATGDFLPENTPKNNFSTNEPIFTNNIPINSARQAKMQKLEKIQSSF